MINNTNQKYTMVKNISGGNKAKRASRGVTTAAPKPLRYAVEGEIYAVVDKILGGSNCHVKCQDNIVRLCVIRKKFKGGNKRDNYLKAGVWCLVGIREWQNNGKIETCDLLEVYNDQEAERLIQSTSVNLNHLVVKQDDSNIVFQEHDDEEISPVMTESIDFDEN